MTDFHFENYPPEENLRIMLTDTVDLTKNLLEGFQKISSKPSGSPSKTEDEYELTPEVLELARQSQSQLSELKRQVSNFVGKRAKKLAKLYSK